MEVDPVETANIPQVADKFKPKHYQTFVSVDEAWDFYLAYAREGGFGVKRGSTKRRNDDGVSVLCWQQFNCMKNGSLNDSYEKKKINESSDYVNERNRGLVRTNCKAKITISKRKDVTQWEIIQFCEAHNHELASPSKVKFITTHRKVSKATKCLVHQLSEANVPTSQQVRILGIQSGGLQNMQCTERDLRNYDRDKRVSMNGYDVASLYDLFTWQKKNPSFCFEFAKDDQDRMTHCFWVDPESRRNYESFGDVVVFDTTYKTNRYHMIFAPIVGVNHHGQTVTFGFGFLGNEKVESFVWFFRQWMKTTLKGPPNMIITDQDPAMKDAIHLVFPDTFHRYCIWHIMEKFKVKLGPLNHELYYRFFRDAVYGSENIEDFEKNWQYALTKSRLHSLSWLNLIYEQREHWVPAFSNHIFSAGMSSSQRAESNHSFFKKYVHEHNSLMDFVTRLNLGLEYQRDKVLYADYQNINEKPKLNSKFLMEGQMSKVYTIKIFHTFQKEFFESAVYIVDLSEEIDNNSKYIVKRGLEECLRIRELVYNKDSDFVKCSCRLFDSEGVPCRHMLAYFRVNQVQLLPEKYILKRWTKEAKVDRIWDNDGVELTNVTDKNLMLRHARLAQLCADFVDEASLSEQGTELFEAAVEDVMVKIREMNLTQGNYPSTSRMNVSDNTTIRDPEQVRAKGSGARLISTREKATNIPRRCGVCKRRGTSHNARTCPYKAYSKDEIDRLLNTNQSEDDDPDYD